METVSHCTAPRSSINNSLPLVRDTLHRTGSFSATAKMTGVPEGDIRRYFPSPSARVSVPVVRIVPPPEPKQAVRPISATPTRTSARAVGEHVAAHYGLTFATLIGDKRTRNIARPRQVAFYCIRRLCKHKSLPDIGRLIGGRDHTTVLHGIRKVEELIGKDADFAWDVASLVLSLEKRLEEARAEAFQAAEPESCLAQALTFQAICEAYGRAMGAKG